MTAPLTLVADGRVFVVTPDMSLAPKTMTVTVTTDVDRKWTFEEPAWRALGYGVSGAILYLWSARRVISFPADRSLEPKSVPVDEDLVIAFKVPSGWLMVCETSIRLVLEVGEISRVELSEVVVGARLEGYQLIVRDLRGVETLVQVGPEGLATH
jgi:hypothetical protein